MKSWKNRRTDPHERSLINAHSFETYQILRHISGFEEIACWAAYHHEEPDGHGYPFHLSAASMSVEARILRVADIFQALAQDRPYRAGLSAAKCWPPCRLAAHGASTGPFWPWPPRIWTGAWRQHCRRQSADLLA
jgi:HD-GYP domain-containing protein (c-di-GMP phosphodiesterase class II)